MKARVAPPAEYQRTSWRAGYARAAFTAGVVEIVRVAVTAFAPVIFAGLLEPKLNVGGFWAPVGLDVMAAVRATLPVKPPLGVTLIVDVLLVVAPGLTDTGVPAIAKLGGGPLPVMDTVDEVLPR